MGGWIPTTDADRKRAAAVRRQGFDMARVTRVPDDSGHVIEAQVVVPGADGESVGSPLPVWVLVPNKGDIATPNKGDTIILGYTKGGFAVCFGVMYTRQERSQIPSYTADERVIGHRATNAEIRISEDGTVTILAESGDKIEVDTNDGSVRVNDGTNSVVYDASVSTTTDVDGHVTSVTLNLSKSDKLKVPS